MSSLPSGYPAPLGPAVDVRVAANIAKHGGNDDDEEEKPSKLTAHVLFFTQVYSYLLIPVLSALLLADAIVYSETLSLLADLERDVRTDCRDVHGSILNLLVLMLIVVVFAILYLAVSHAHIYLMFLRALFATLLYLASGALAIYNTLATVYIGKQQGYACKHLDDDGEMAWKMVLAVTAVVWCVQILPIIVIALFWWFDKMNALIAFYAPKVSLASLLPPEGACSACVCFIIKHHGDAASSILTVSLMYCSLLCGLYAPGISAEGFARRGSDRAAASRCAILSARALPPCAAASHTRCRTNSETNKEL
jgi:hypothetical protein